MGVTGERSDAGNLSKVLSALSLQYRWLDIIQGCT